VIDFKNKIIFIHIPKTGGTSVEMYFQKIRNLSDHDISSLAIFKNKKESNLERGNQHCSLSMYEKFFFGGRIPEDYRIFTIVRNPYTRFWSEWSSRKLPPPSRFIVSFYLPLILLIFLSKKKYNFLKDFNSHMKPQSSFLFGKNNYKIKILRFENLNEEFEQLIEDWHLPKIKLSRSNKSRRLRKPFKYELRLGKRFIERFYRDDFKIFSYKK